MPFLAQVAGPSGAMLFLWPLGHTVLFFIVATLPLDSRHALAGMAAGMRTESILFLPAVALNMTASTLVGHCLGAGDREGAKQLGWRIIMGGAGVMTMAALLLWPFMRDIIAAVVPDPQSQAYTLAYLRFNLMATPFTIASMCLGGIMAVAGAAVFTLVVYGSAIWLVCLPLGYLFGHLIWQSADGVFLGAFASQFCQSVIIRYIFQTRNWARFAMRKQCART